MYPFYLNGISSLLWCKTHDILVVSVFSVKNWIEIRRETFIPFVFDHSSQHSKAKTTTMASTENYITGLLNLWWHYVDKIGKICTGVKTAKYVYNGIDKFGRSAAIFTKTTFWLPVFFVFWNPLGMGSIFLKEKTKGI